MQKENENKEEPQEVEYDDKVKFGYIPSVIFLVFIAFVVYISVT